MIGPHLIHQLSPALVNRIAAGEVIERPAAVVKELVENAIDAGASEINVEIEDGGRALIRVVDNGSGIGPDDLALAFASHATSKLSCDDDLFRISTMGFRGEALASVGAVSHARILSRTRDDEAAWEIFDRGGVISDPQAAAGNVGSTVEVRNLFFNTPARRKFIKGASTEFGHISEMLLRLALPHPHIAFALIHNDRPALKLPACPPEQRLLAAWPKEFHEAALGIDVRDAELRLHGIVGLPELCKPTARHQYFYLNGRHVRDRFVQHALREAYRGLSEPGRQPAAVLLLQIPPQDVDVNVHPTKIEVRFRDSGRIHGLVFSVIREKLQSCDLTPVAVPLRDDGAGREDLREKLAAFFKQGFSPEGTAPAVAQPRLPMGTEANWGQNVSKTTGFDFIPPSRDSPAQDRNGVAFSDHPPFVAQTAESRAIAGRSTLGASPTSPFDGPLARQPSGWPSHQQPHHAGASSQPAIQLHNSYLVAQSEDGLVIIDQHALHERIMYEELLTRLSRGPLESQRMLIPEVLDVSTTQMALLEQIQPLLGRLGIEVAAFGPTSVAVQAFPSFLEKLNPGAFVRELLERGEQELLDLHDEEVLHEVMDMMACKAAVKAGDPLTPQEIDALLARRELVDRSSNCPHGRPTTLRLSLRDLEKQFKRRGF